MADIFNTLGQNNSGVSIWGSITGNILNQEDLIDYLENNYYPLDTNPLGYLTLSDLPSPIIPNLQAVVTAGGEVISADGLSKIEIDKDNGQIKISTRPTTGDAWVLKNTFTSDGLAVTDGTDANSISANQIVFTQDEAQVIFISSIDKSIIITDLITSNVVTLGPDGVSFSSSFDTVILSSDKITLNGKESLLPTASSTPIAPQKLALKPILNSEDFTAELGVDYETDQDLTVTDPTDQTGSYRVFVTNNTATIGGVAYPKGSRIYRYYDGTSWNTIVLATTDNITTPDLQIVTDVNLNIDGYAETTNGILTSKLIAENFKVDSALEYFDFGGITPNFHYSPSGGLIIQDDAQENGVVLFQSGLLQFIKNSFSTDLEPTATTARFLYLPDKDGTLATTDDITALDLQTITDVNNTITDGTNTMYLNPSSIEIQGIVNQMQILSDQLIFSDGVNNSSYFLGFINNNGVNYLLPTGTSSQIATLANIPTLDATPTNGSTNGVESNGVFDALATKVTFWGSAVNGTTVANTLTITPTYSQLIPANTFVAGDVIYLKSRSYFLTSKTSASSIYFYVNTADNLSGATQLAIYTSGSTSRTLLMERNLSVKGSTTRGVSPTTSLPSDVGIQAGMINHTIDWTVDQYIIFAIGHTASDQTLTGDFYSIEKK